VLSGGEADDAPAQDDNPVIGQEITSKKVEPLTKTTSNTKKEF
jgi:hypothetical protein